MAVVYEVWDTLTANRIGVFPSQHDAEALLLDVLRVNGIEAAQDMAVLSSDTNDPDMEPELVVDGAEFVAHHQVPV